MPQVNVPGNSRHLFARGLRGPSTLTGNVTLNGGSAFYQFLNPNGTARTVTLPALTNSFGLAFKITNTDVSVTAAALTIATAAAATLCTVLPGQTVDVVCDGATWNVATAGNELQITLPLSAGSTARTLYVAKQAITVTSISTCLSKAQGGALTATIVKATSTSAPVKSTTPMMTADSIDLNAATNTVVAYTLTSTAADLTLAAGDRIGIDHGAMTTAELSIFIGYKKV